MKPIPTLAFLLLKFIYAEKAIKFCEISTLYLTVTTLHRTVEISQKFVAFLEYVYKLYKISLMLSKKLMGFKEILKIDIAWGPAKIGHDCRNFEFEISKRGIASILI